LSVQSILGPGGRIARRVEAYEHRPQQIQVAKAIDLAMLRGRHLVAEAGTGTGKSFAYLTPAILHATEAAIPFDQRRRREGLKIEEENNRPRRVVISTHTISLQEQLMAKDIPLLNSVTPREFSAVLAKGRSNYLSLRRLQRAREQSSTLFGYDNQSRQLRDIHDWSRDTHDGSLATLPARPDRSVWEEVMSDTGNCLGRKCDTYEQCFYYAARRRLQSAQLMVVNHAMFFTDMAIRRTGGSLLPDFDVVVLDECHNLESVAGDHLGMRITSGQVTYSLNKLFNSSRNKGLLVTHELTSLCDMVSQLRFIADEFFADIFDFLAKGAQRNGRVMQPECVENQISKPLEALGKAIGEYGEQLDKKRVADKKDFQSAAERIYALAGGIRTWVDQSMEDSVYWIERTGSTRGSDRITLAAAPIDVGQTLRTELFQSETIRSVILTSATLAVGNDDNFSFYRGRIGLTGGDNVRVGSPFDYRQQARLVTVRDMPDPSSDRDAFEKQLPRMLLRYINESDGHAFVLFTSYDLLRKSASAVSAELANRKIDLFTQGGNLTNGPMLKKFRETPRSVLFGTSSFWQGVDVAGDALQNVIITKLPFSVPDHPLLEARLEQIRSSGGNPFMEYQVPEAVIKLRQGFGRLIRSAEDRGMVVILDPRVHTKRYGSVFLESLPEMKARVDSIH
ncbi:MAG: helicase C-terminal domain-containing protein, partial [Planctomycetota bacterium]